MNRRQFLKSAGVGVSSIALSSCARFPGRQNSGRGKKPNLLFVFADQWRAQDTGYAGNTDVYTPHLDRLAAESVNFVNAVSCCPVCAPYRASLMTGRYPLRHGVILNDLQLNRQAVSLADAFNHAGYETTYIGKWHLDGMGRIEYTPSERRQGFQNWQTVECTHDYNDSDYYTDTNPVRKKWPGYDAVSQTDAVINRLFRYGQDDKPFAMFLSWGPPHEPYETAPEIWQDKYRRKALSLRKNVPAEFSKQALQDIRGYYAHISALDHCMGRLLDALQETGLDKDTIVVFTSDHGDMLYSQGQQKKQRPWDESVRVPFLLRLPTAQRNRHTDGTIPTPLNSPDIMPTLLGLCGIEIPGTIDGDDLSPVLLGGQLPPDHGALIMCPTPFGQWLRTNGGQEFRGVRTSQWTYVRDLTGPWLLYDNQNDPYQLKNLVNLPEYKSIQDILEDKLRYWLTRTHDPFLSGAELIRKGSYKVDATGTIDYTNKEYWGQVSVDLTDK